MTLSPTIEDTGCPNNLAPKNHFGASADPQAFVRKDGKNNTLDLAVYGAKCAGCISKIEGGVNRLDGVNYARLNLSTGKLSISWLGNLAAKEITDTVTQLGYRVAAFDPDGATSQNDAYGKKLLRCLAVAGFASTNIMLLSIGVWANTQGEMGEATRDLMHLVSGLIAIPAALFAGQPFFISAWSALKVKQANMDVPISLAVLLALGFSLFEALNSGADAYFDAAVMLLFFLLIGRWLDHAMRQRARDAALDLAALQTVTANIIDDDGNISSISSRDINPGDRILLLLGDRVVVDGVLESGGSDMDTSFVTGETACLFQQKGDAIQSGLINLSQRVTMIATHRVEDSLIAEIARLVETGQQNKNKFVRIADKAAKLYVPVVHTLAIATFLFWLFIVEAGIRVSMLNAIAVLIITCPCALGLATPVVQVVATSRLFRNGILVKHGDALERLAQIDGFVFDKTGTLTLGEMRLINRADIPPSAFEAVAALARTSHHSIARSIVREAGAGPMASDVTEIPGQGVSGTVNNIDISLGNAEFIGVEAQEIDAVTSWMRWGDQDPILLKFEDTLRADAAGVIERLHQNKLSIAMLTGDRTVPAKSASEQSGINEWHAMLTPQDKADYMRQYKDKGVKLAMVGDGINDAPALAFAHVSLSPGSATQAAQSAADFVFQGKSLSPIIDAWQMARKSQQRILENFAFAALYNVIAAPLAMAGYVTPLIAALAMSGSSIIVTLNALRLPKRRSAKI